MGVQVATISHHGNFKDKLVKNVHEQKAEEKPSAATLFRNTRSFSIQSMKRGIQNALHKPRGKRLPSIYEDFRERNLVLDISKDSKLNMTPSEKEQIKKYADQLKDRKNDKLLKDINFDSIKRQFSLSHSKSKILKNIVEDYKKGKKLSLKLPKSNVKMKDLSKTDIKSILDHYQAQKERKQYRFFDQVENLKKKISLTASKAGILEKMKGDYRNGKFSVSDVPNMSKIHITDLNKENLHKILDHYKEHHMKKSSYTFIKQSKIKQLKSDLRAKLNAL